MSRAVVVIGFTLLFAYAAFAQVHIRDTVAISPQAGGKQLKDLDSRTVYLRYRSTITVTPTGGTTI